jgi:AraC family L-rhamnose operon transcriptional activator RhaR
MRELPHAPGYTLNADALIGPSELLGFATAHHPLSVFEHFHDFYELALVLRGTGLHITSDGGRMVRRGIAIFVAPGVSHGYEMGDDLTVYNCFLRVEAVQFDMPWAPRDGRLGRLFSPMGLVPRLPLVVALNEDAFLTCLGHLDAIRGRDAADRSEAHDLGHLLLALDVLASRLEHDDSEHVVVDPRAPSMVAAAIELLEQDLQRHWTLDELAGQLCIGPFHLVRLFKRWLGMPPIAWSNRRRAERAAILLATTDEPVAAIGAQVGWPDPSYFSRRFRQEFGVGARTYRARSHEHQAAAHPGARDTTALMADADVWVPPR